MIVNRECRRCRQAIDLWVGDSQVAKPAPEIESHLTSCGECRRYAEEHQAATAGLRWLSTRRVEPTPGLRSRWTTAVEEAAKPSGVAEAGVALLAWGRSLLLRNRKPLLALAPVWILIVLFKISAPAARPPTVAARSPFEIFHILKAQEQLMADRSQSDSMAPAVRRRAEPVQPRSQAPANQLKAVQYEHC